jgi:excisionase family DNA binding protein
MLTSRDVAEKLKVKKRLVDKLVYELIDEGKLEYYSVGGATYIRIPKPEEE